MKMVNIGGLGLRLATMGSVVVETCAGQVHYLGQGSGQSYFCSE